ncbi:MAG: hypothetical protein ACI4MA_03535 [Treponema sp.]
MAILAQLSLAEDDQTKAFIKLVKDTKNMILGKKETSDRLLSDSELRYPYEESKTLMHVFDSFDDKALILELLEGIHL